MRKEHFFDAIFTTDMQELLVTETNSYHEQQVAAQLSKHKRKWSPVTQECIHQHYDLHGHRKVVACMSLHVLEHRQPPP